jgi:hypothetical protein
MGKEFNSSYAQTSDPNLAKRTVFQAFPDEAKRRALSGLINRLVGTTHPHLRAGTAGVAEGGIALDAACNFVVDGKVYAGTANTNFEIPASLGTQGTAAWCKYLVSWGTSGAITITKGNETTAGSSGAFLPDLPDESAAIGYFTILTAGAKWTAGTNAPADGSNTVGYYDLWNMPVTEH